MRQKVSGVRQEMERVPPQVWHRRPYICVGRALVEPHLFTRGNSSATAALDSDLYSPKRLDKPRHPPPPPPSPPPPPPKKPKKNTKHQTEMSISRSAFSEEDADDGDVRSGPATTEGRTNQRVLTPVQRGHIASLHLPRRNWTLPYTNCPDNTSYHPQREDTASLHLLRRNRTLPRTRCVLTPGAIQGGRTHCLAAPSTEELDPAPHQLSW
ncbi:hypothetical protein E2C01_047221 [Portunus trituberculatus]|uniref:Uncharacterized protein n=1 Tax=Portunus trituberculatus TaxID=210409 RepID=A0A5B7G319_PORTR|nr:hypothetical protein [Portunus trituberculatus]